nr:MAG TPA: hypothetical protein [Caudoviricetes sp.]
MKKINDYLTTPDLLCQLAEEASELAQAALKLKRASVNPKENPVQRWNRCVYEYNRERVAAYRRYNG